MVLFHILYSEIVPICYQVAHVLLKGCLDGGLQAIATPAQSRYEDSDDIIYICVCPLDPMPSRYVLHLADSLLKYDVRFLIMNTFATTKQSLIGILDHSESQLQELQKLALKYSGVNVPAVALPLG